MSQGALAEALCFFGSSLRVLLCGEILLKLFSGGGQTADSLGLACCLIIGLVFSHNGVFGLLENPNLA